jgi:RHS repeat-associated protein
MGIDELYARVKDSADTLSYYLTDHLGSVRDIVDNSATVVSHITYDSFGKVLSETNSTLGDRFKYTGRELDSTTGLYYYRARWYDTHTGRFASEDPIGFSAGDSNLRRYVGNAVTGATDPSGLDEIKIGVLELPQAKREEAEQLIMGLIDSAKKNGGERVEEKIEEILSADHDKKVALILVTNRKDILGDSYFNPNLSDEKKLVVQPSAYVDISDFTNLPSLPPISRNITKDDYHKIFKEDLMIHILVEERQKLMEWKKIEEWKKDKNYSELLGMFKEHHQLAIDWQNQMRSARSLPEIHLQNIITNKDGSKGIEVTFERGVKKYVEFSSKNSAPKPPKKN